MANPQAENGHIDIAHDIAEAFAHTRIPGEAMQVLWVILRKTWGWKKKSDKISVSQMSKATGLKRSRVSESLAQLLEMGVVSKKETGVSVYGDTLVNEWRFNKDYDQWIVSPKKGTGISKKGDTVSPIMGGGVSPIMGNTKETSTKENTTKENTNTCVFQKTTQENGNGKYPHDFEAFWKLYPRQIEKRAAYKAWCTRRKEGVSSDDLILAAGNYATYCMAQGAEPKYIKHPSTFLGPSKPYEEYVDPEIPKAFNVYEQAAMSDPDEILQKMLGRTESIIDAKRAGLGEIHNADEDDIRSDKR